MTFAAGHSVAPKTFWGARARIRLLVLSLASALVSVGACDGGAGCEGCAGCACLPAPAPPATAVPVAAAPVAVAVADAVVDDVNAARAAAHAAVDAHRFDDALALLDKAVALVGAGHDGIDRGALLCDRAAVLSQRAAAASTSKQKERDLRAAVGDCPSEPLLRRALANALILRARELGTGADERNARRALLEMSLKTEETAAAAVDLARLCDEDNDVACAVAAVAVAVRLEPDNPGVKSLSERVQRQGAVEGAFRSARHTHFVARFEGYGEERLAWAALDVLERAYFSVGQALDLHPADPITVIIYTGAQYQQATSTPDWSTGVFDGKIRIREGLLAAAQGTLTDTLTHEYVHAALRNSVPETAAAGVPIWFHEGLAQHFESSPKDPAALLARTGKAPLETLPKSFLGLSASAAQAAYATSLALVELLVQKRGTYGLQQLLGEMKRGASFDDALSTSYATTLAKLYAELPESN